MPKIFISYRRDDTSGYAGRLLDFLASRFGRGNVFFDVWSLQPGTDFVAVIEEKVGTCDALIALIGKHWLESRGAAGNRRLDEPEDPVRQEIAAALQRGILVIPVLVDGASMPDARRLAPDLQGLVRRQALSLGNERWSYDCDRLLRSLSVLTPRTPRRWRGFQPALAVLALVLVTLAPTASRHIEPIVIPAKVDVPLLGILPFEDRIQNPEAVSLGQGLAILLTEMLTTSNHLAVTSGRRMAIFSGTGQDEGLLRHIAAAAGINYLLAGRVEAGAASLNLKLVVRLLSVRTGGGEERWEFRGSAKELFAKTGEIVALVRQRIGLPPLERIGVLAADFYIDDPEAYQAYAVGLRSLMDYHYEDAARAFRAALQKQPGFTMARYRLSQTYAVTGRTREAKHLIAQVKREAQLLSSREAGYVRAAALSFDRDYDAAAEAYRELVESFPYDIEARQLRAQVLRDMGAYEQALQEWNIIRSLEPDLYTTWNFLGDVYMRMGRFDEAVRCLLQSLSLDSRRADTHETLGNVYRASGRSDDAAAEYGEALRLDPTFHDAALQLALLNALQGKREGAERRLEPIVFDRGALPRHRIDAVIELAYLLMAKGRFSAAAETLGYLQPELEGEGIREALALSVRGLCALELGDLKNARRLIDLSVRRSPSRVTTRYLFARGLLEIHSSSFPGVKRTTGEIRKLALPPGDPDRTEDKAAEYLEGMALLAQGKTHPAIELLQSAVDLEGYEYRRYRLGLARAYLAAGQLDEASRAVLKAMADLHLVEPRLDLELDRSRGLLLLAEIEKARGRHAEAVARAHQFLQAWRGADPGLPDIACALKIAGSQRGILVRVTEPGAQTCDSARPLPSKSKGKP